MGKLNEGHEYKFRVKAVNRQGTSAPLQTDHAIVAKNPFDEPGAPTDVTPVDWDKDHVDLEWKVPFSKEMVVLHKLTSTIAGPRKHWRSSHRAVHRGKEGQIRRLGSVHCG